MLETIFTTLKMVFALTFLQLLNFRLVFLLSGERAILDSISAVNKQIWSFGGFILTCMALLWILNQELQHFFEQLFFLTFSSLLVWRIVKGLLLAVQLRYKWYYLILYLCTLEILPLLILSKLAWHNFSPLI
jgi:hypothetical protein